MKHDIVNFEQEVRRLWQDGGIPEDPSHPNEYHDNPAIGPNIYQVNTYYIKPTTLPHDTSYALMLHPGGLDCDVFVTHAWDEGVFEFARKLQQMWPSDARNLYCCFLSNPQNGNIARLLGNDPMRSPFAEAMTVARHVLVVPNSKTSIYSRLWCVFEASLAIQQGKHIRMPMTYSSHKVALQVLFVAILFAVGNIITSATVEGSTDLIQCYTISDAALLLLITSVVILEMWHERLTQLCDGGLLQHGVISCMLGLLSGVYTARGQHIFVIMLSLDQHAIGRGNYFFVMLLLAAAACRSILSIKADVLKREQGLLGFRTVRAADCSNALDKQRIRAAIQGSEDAIDNAIRALKQVGRYSPSVQANLQRGLDASRLRDGISPFVLMVSIIVWERSFSVILSNALDVSWKRTLIGDCVLAAASLLVMVAIYRVGDDAIFFVDACTEGMLAMTVCLNLMAIVIFLYLEDCSRVLPERGFVYDPTYLAAHSSTCKWAYVFIWCFFFLITVVRSLAFRREWQPSLARCLSLGPAGSASVAESSSESPSESDSEL